MSKLTSHAQVWGLGVVGPGFTNQFAPNRTSFRPEFLSNRLKYWPHLFKAENENRTIRHILVQTIGPLGIGIRQQAPSLSLSPGPGPGPVMKVCPDLS